MQGTTAMQFPTNRSNYVAMNRDGIVSIDTAESVKYLVRSKTRVNDSVNFQRVDIRCGTRNKNIIGLVRKLYGAGALNKMERRATPGRDPGYCVHLLIAIECRKRVIRTSGGISRDRFIF